jgi:glutamate carboxypeptidase
VREQLQHRHASCSTAAQPALIESLKDRSNPAAPIYEAGILQTQPYKLDGNKLYGPGIADDKGSIALILHALKILADAGWKDYATLTVLVNADEEVNSVNSGETIAALADQHDVVLSCEPAGAKAVVKVEALLLGAAGIAAVTMETKGRAAHAGAAPEQGTSLTT